MRDCARSGWIFAVLAIAGIALAGRQDGTEKTTELRVERKDIPYAVKYEFSRLVGSGRLVRAVDGKPGQLVRTYKVTLSGGKPLKKELVAEERIEPRDAKFLMGRSRYAPDRHGFVRSQVLDMVATAYPPNPRHPWSTRPSHTATGRPAGFGLVAVDPRIIPMGTPLFIEGYGFALAADTGGAIKGHRIDLGMATNSLCRSFGRRHVRVHLLRRS